MSLSLLLAPNGLNLLKLDRSSLKVQSTELLRSNITLRDICFRYAGDEFMITLSECGREEAERKRLELQTAVDTLHFEPRPGTMLRLGISVGVAVYPHDGADYPHLAEAADRRMYEDKLQRANMALRRSDESSLTHVDSEDLTVVHDRRRRLNDRRSPKQKTT